MSTTPIARQLRWWQYLLIKIFPSLRRRWLSTAAGEQPAHGVAAASTDQIIIGKDGRTYQKHKFSIEGMQHSVWSFSGVRFDVRSFTCTEYPGIKLEPIFSITRSLAPFERGAAIRAIQQDIRVSAVTGHENGIAISNCFVEPHTPPVFCPRDNMELMYSEPASERSLRRENPSGSMERHIGAADKYYLWCRDSDGSSVISCAALPAEFLFCFAKNMLTQKQQKTTQTRDLRDKTYKNQ